MSTVYLAMYLVSSLMLSARNLTRPYTFLFCSKITLLQGKAKYDKWKEIVESECTALQAQSKYAAVIIEMFEEIGIDKEKSFAYQASKASE